MAVRLLNPSKLRVPRRGSTLLLMVCIRLAIHNIHNPKMLVSQEGMALLPAVSRMLPMETGSNILPRVNRTLPNMLRPGSPSSRLHLYPLRITAPEAR